MFITLTTACFTRAVGHVVQLYAKCVMQTTRPCMVADIGRGHEMTLSCDVGRTIMRFAIETRNKKQDVHVVEKG